MGDRSQGDYAWFQDQLGHLLPSHRGEHALIHNSSIVEFFSSSLDAVKAGLIRFGEENFTVELVDDRVEDLGFYSHVSTALHA